MKYVIGVIGIILLILLIVSMCAYLISQALSDGMSARAQELNAQANLENAYTRQSAQQAQDTRELLAELGVILGASGVLNVGNFVMAIFAGYIFVRLFEPVIERMRK